MLFGRVGVWVVGMGVEGVEVSWEIRTSVLHAGSSA
jgi:hypothetical protein